MIRLSNKAKLPGNWPVPYFFVTTYSSFILSVATKYQLDFSDTEEFNLAFGFLIRNLIFADVRKVFELYNGLHEKRFIQFLETHLLEFSYLFENSTLTEFSNKWINSIQENKFVSPSRLENQSNSKTNQFHLPEIVIDENIIDKLFDILRPFFPNQHDGLKKALNGETVSSKLVFASRANRFAYVFLQLQDGGKIISDAQTTKQWICKNFQFIESGKAKNFKINTVQSVFNYTLPVSKKNQIDLSYLLKS